TTGYAFVLRKLLQKGGLGENDYTFDKLGSTSQRAEALMQNKTAATILTSPLEILPESKGYRRLANAVDVIGPYQAVSGIARRSEFGRPQKKLDDPSKYVDESYYQRALGATGLPPPQGVEKQNMDLVGSNDLQARSAYQPIVQKQGERWIAYIGHHGGKSLNP